MSRSRSRLVVSAVLLVGVLVGVACNGGGVVGSASINTAQTVLDLSDAVVGLQQRESEMQLQLDSLQRTVARQDTLIIRLSQASGVALPARP
jgi:predicted membrane-bound mannosyltransferase